MAISHDICFKVSILLYCVEAQYNNALYMADIVWKYNITYVLYMAISHGIFFKVSILQYYYIVWKYNITYILCMAISHGIFFQSVYVTILLYCVKVQYNVHALYVY